MRSSTRTAHRAVAKKDQRSKYRWNADAFDPGLRSAAEQVLLAVDCSGIRRGPHRENALVVGILCERLKNFKIEAGGGLRSGRIARMLGRTARRGHFPQQTLKTRPWASPMECLMCVSRLALLIGLFLPLNSAHASGGHCPTAPSNWDAASCSVGGTPVCDWNGSGEWLCNVSAAAGNSNVTVVSDYLTTSGDDYEAWGDVNGVLFCCEAECDVETNVRIEGSPGSDVLTFEYSALTYNLNSACGNNISGTINGNNGNDTIRGSNSAAGT